MRAKALPDPPGLRKQVGRWWAYAQHPHKAIRLFQTENEEMVGGLISACQDLKEYCDRQSASGTSSRRKSKEGSGSGAGAGAADGAQRPSSRGSK